MTDNERDTKFLGFANLLYEDFLQLARDDESTINEMLASDYPEKWQGKVETLIAQRAYDLAMHIVKQFELPYDPNNLITYRGYILMLQDLTEWPTREQ